MTNMAISTGSSPRARILAALAGAFAHDLDEGEDPPLRRARGRQLAGVGRGQRRPAVRPARRVDCPTTAIIRPSPASPCRCSSTFPRPARPSSFDGWSSSRSSTWTAARSTSCWSAAARASADEEATSEARSDACDRSARACRTSGCSRRCRRGRDSAACSTIRSRVRRPRKAPSSASSASTWSGERLAIWSKRVRPARVEHRGELGADALQRFEIVGRAARARQVGR